MDRVERGALVAEHVSQKVKSLAPGILRALAECQALTLVAIAEQVATSTETANKALDYLRDLGAPIEYSRRTRKWVLADKDFSLPLEDPNSSDLLAMLTAAGMLTQLGQDAAARRARSIFNHLAVRAREGSGERVRPDGLRVTQTTSKVRRPEIMLSLLRSAGRRVVVVTSQSPWTEKKSRHEFEPWQVWIHDGIPYVRGYSRTKNAPRTFGLANIQDVETLPSERPGVRRPDDPWAGDDPRYGIDGDRPGEAVLRLRGGVARWVASLVWHPYQCDSWTDGGEVLERLVPYRSCREFARKVVTVADGLVDVQPDELRAEVRTLLRSGLSAVEGTTEEEASANASSWGSHRDTPHGER